MMKQFFKFDKHIFPPADAPIRRGMVIGLFVSIAAVAVVLLIAYSYPIRAAEDVFKAQFVIALIAGLAGFPWSALFFSFGLVGLTVPILLNGVFFGFLIGAIVKIRREKAPTIRLK